MNMYESKYCKFCNKEKPMNEFCKSGGAIKNICRECQNKKQKQMYSDAKKVKQLQQENKQLKEKLDCDLQWAFKYEKQVDNWNKLKEYIDKTKIEEFEKSYGKRYGKTFTQAEIIVCNMIKNKIKELERGVSDVED